MKKLIPLVALLCLTAVHASPFSEAFPPFKKIDRAGEKPDFAAFRAKLLQVIGRRDAQALQSYLSPEIHYSFGVEKPGIAGFYSVWKPSERNSPLWTELADVLRNGGSFDKNGQFVAPSWYANWPAGRDESEWGVVSDSPVVVYAQPRESGKKLPSIGNCWVQISPNGDNQEDPKFVCIDLPKSMQNAFKVESAFVKSEKVHRLLGYRAIFAKRDGRWEMKSFIAGD